MNEIRFNQPPREASVVAEENNKKTKSSFFNLKKILKFLSAVLILVVVFFTLFLSKDFITNMFMNKNEVYSAVFLANGQVYFGKMIDNNKSEIILNNVFYIQISDKVGQTEASANLNQSSFNLIKLGNELHGPTDELFINRSQVVFYENLRGDSKVVESIKNYKK